MNFGKGDSDGLFLFEDGGEVEATEFGDWIKRGVTLVDFFVAEASVKDVRFGEGRVCDHIIFIVLSKNI
jgi:hypothetical protein